MNQKLAIKILEAIKLLAEACDEYQISHKVEHDVLKQPFKKSGESKIYINIELTKLV